MEHLIEKWSEAIAEGRILDVSHLTREVVNPYPTFVTRGLWDVRKLEHREERLRVILANLVLRDWLARGRHGEFTCWFAGVWLDYPLHLRVVIDPDREHGRIVTFLLEGERLDFEVARPANGGSFFVM